MTTSFIPVPPLSHFPIQNLPYGVFIPTPDVPPRVGVAIGEYVLDLAVLEAAGYFKGCFDTDARLYAGGVFAQPTLNAFMGLGQMAWHNVRAILQRVLDAENPTLRDDESLRRAALHLRDDVTLYLPVQIGDYTDFYASKEHATNVGTMFRGAENALPPNWLHLPIGYHGRASSVVLSGTDIRRPHGQIKAPDADMPVFMPSQRMDFELEMGVFIGTGNTLGTPIAADAAPDHLFGMVLVNDWSARDIQRWEYQPLGPFLSKNLATSISPWVVPMAALAPFRCAGAVQQPVPLPYLQTMGDHAYDIQLEVYLQGQRICRTNFRHMYWNICQQVAHHTITGCNLRTGDLLASGTISGSTPDAYGSLLEITWNGEKPLHITDEGSRTFLEDGDTVQMTGWCEGDGYRVGFGDVIGTVQPAQL